MEKVFNLLFSKWSKWEIYKANERCIKTTFAAPLLGLIPLGEESVLVDIYVRTHKSNGLKQYKRVVKYS